MKQMGLISQFMSYIFEVLRMSHQRIEQATLLKNMIFRSA